MQTAIAIEHATMPLYAAAMYSIEVQNYPAYNTMRSVLMEEMLHMAAACNTLAGLGGAPRLRTLDPTATLNGLPARIAPDVRPRIAKLSHRQLDVFMRIESPPEMLPATAADSRYPTIDSFYEQIRQAVERNATAVTAAVRGRHVANQVGGNLGYVVVDADAKEPVDQILAALDLIVHQGRGAGQTTLSSGDGSENELSHYARFAELRFGRAYSGPGRADHRGGPPSPGSQPSHSDSSRALGPTEPPRGDGEIGRESQRRWFRGERISWPKVINTLAVPSDGYAAVLREDPNRVHALRELRAFDEAYTRMLAALDDSWNGPVEQSWPSLGRAVLEMNELRVLSCFNISRLQIPPQVIARLNSLYPGEIDALRSLTDIDAPTFYGPRFRNTSRPS